MYGVFAQHRLPAVFLLVVRVQLQQAALTFTELSPPNLTLRGQAGSTYTRTRIQRQLALPGL